MICSTRYPNNNGFTPDYTTASDETFGRMERQSSEDYQDDFEEEFDGESSGTMRYNDAAPNQSNTYSNNNRSKYK